MTLLECYNILVERELSLIVKNKKRRKITTQVKRCFTLIKRELSLVKQGSMSKSQER